MPLVKTHQLPRETTTWTFDSHVIRSCSLKQPQICTSRSQANDFFAVLFSILLVGRYSKTLNDWLRGKQLVLFPRDILFPLGQGIKCLLYWSSYLFLLVFEFFEQPLQLVLQFWCSIFKRWILRHQLFKSFSFATFLRGFLEMLEKDKTVLLVIVRTNLYH